MWLGNAGPVWLEEDPKAGGKAGGKEAVARREIAGGAFAVGRHARRGDAISEVEKW